MNGFLRNNVLLLLAIALPLLFMLNISLGSLYIPFREIIAVVFGEHLRDDVYQQIILHIRFPKAITAILAGIGLGISGLQMQTLFRNPLAGPFILGISSGAGLGVAILILGASALLLVFPSLNVISYENKIIAACLGSALVLLMIMLINVRIKDSMVLLIAGLMFGTFASALISILQYFSPAEQLQTYLMWTFGSLASLDQKQLVLLSSVILIGLVLGYSILKSMNAMLLGEQYAKSLGVNTSKTAFIAILSTALLAGSITAFCGPLAFVGLSVPHIARLLIPSSNQFKLYPATLLLGANLMLICDIIAQMPGSSLVLPINAITSLFGAPIVIWLITRNRKIAHRF